MSELVDNQDLEEFLKTFKGGLKRFFQVSKSKHELCEYTIMPLKILNCLGVDHNIIANLLHPPAPYDKNSNMYHHIETIDDAAGFIQALDETNNKKALDIIRKATERIKLEGILIQPQSSGTGDEQGSKVLPESGRRESTAQPSDIREVQLRQSPGTSAQHVPTRPSIINEPNYNGNFSHVQTSSTSFADPGFSSASNSSRDLSSPSILNFSPTNPSSKEIVVIAHDSPTAKEYLMTQVDNGASVEDLIKPKLTDICKRSKNIGLFLTDLYSNDAISMTEQEEINKCSENYGPIQAFKLIYDSLIKSNNGAAMIKAWEASENYHIIKLCSEHQQQQRRQSDERRVSRDQVLVQIDEEQQQKLNYLLQVLQQKQQELQPPQQMNHLEPSRQRHRSASNTGRPESMVSVGPLDATDSPYTQTSSCPSGDPDMSNYSRNSSNASLWRSSPSTQVPIPVPVTKQSRRYSKSGTLKKPLTLIKGQLIEKGTKTVHLNWVETKAKYLAQACQNCQETLKRIKIENIILIPPDRSKVRQRFSRVQCNCPKLKEFLISEKASLKIIRFTTLKSLMFFTPINFHFDKSPTLCTVMKESELNNISYKKGGVTFIHLKKGEDDDSRNLNLKLVLRYLSFLKCEAFLTEAASVFTTFSFSAYQYEFIDRSLNVLLKPEQVTELVLIKVSFTSGSEILYKFKNLTKLIFHLNEPETNAGNYFELDLCKLLSSSTQLKKLVLRHVPLVHLSAGDRNNIMVCESVMLYMCPLQKVPWILTDLEKADNVGWENKLMFKWEKETGNKEFLVWDKDSYFNRFQMGDFFEKEVWDNEYAKYFVTSNN